MIAELADQVDQGKSDASIVSYFVQKYGMTVLAVRAKEGEAWTYNPDANVKIGPGMTLVVLGSAEQVSQLKDATK